VFQPARYVCDGCGGSEIATFEPMSTLPKPASSINWRIPDDWFIKPVDRANANGDVFPSPTEHKTMPYKVMHYCGECAGSMDARSRKKLKSGRRVISIPVVNPTLWDHLEDEE
jgi:hypothetical protein